MAERVEALHRLLEHLAPPPCLSQYLALDFPKSCVVISTGRLLSIGIIVGSTLVKLPQIFAILAQGSVLGLSQWAVVLELLGSSTMSAYNIRRANPFLAWGEVLFTTIQAWIIVALYWYYYYLRGGGGRKHAESAESRGVGATGGSSATGVSPVTQLLFPVGFSISYAAFFTYVFTAMPSQLLPALGSVPMVVGVAARLPQILL
eukprot:Filipodium_phascolosomae@DN3593_c0_g1_i1.p1